MKDYYDFVLVGGGAAGLSLARALVNSPLRDRSILLVDKERKDRNDRTWCYWTCEPTPYDGIRYFYWENLRITGQEMQQEFLLPPYRYQMVRGIDFYRLVHEELAGCTNVDIVQGEVHSVQDAPADEAAGVSAAAVSIDGRLVHAGWAFDSRILPGDIQAFTDGNRPRYRYLKQHFTGWQIETPNPAFDPRTATLFDLRIPQRAGLTFLYVLPFSPQRALVEYTLFSEHLLPEDEYERALHDYIANTLQIPQYRVLEREHGVIPMTDRPFSRRRGERVLAIGTLGGRVKPSTGYAFQRIQRDAQAIVDSLVRTGAPLDLPPDRARYRFYDALLLEILANQSCQARPVFEALFANNPIDRIFRFLDEQSTFWEDVQLIASLPPAPFLRALGAYLLRKRKA